MLFKKKLNLNKIHFHRFINLAQNMINTHQQSRHLMILWMIENQWFLGSIWVFKKISLWLLKKRVGFTNLIRGIWLIIGVMIKILLHGDLVLIAKIVLRWKCLLFRSLRDDGLNEHQVKWANNWMNMLVNKNLSKLFLIYVYLR